VLSRIDVFEAPVLLLVELISLLCVLRNWERPAIAVSVVDN
jgi:hypothetical protein